MAHTDWYYIAEGKTIGPVTAGHISLLYQRGDLTGADLVWSEYTEGWTPLDAVSHYVAREVVPPFSGPGHVDGAGRPWPGEGGASSHTEPGFPRRVMGFAVDCLLIGVGGVVLGVLFVTLIAVAEQLGALAGIRRFTLRAPFLAVHAPIVPWPVWALMTVLGGWLYHGYMESGPLRATVGKLAFGMEVRGSAGRPVTFAQATARYWGKYLSAALLGAGFLLALATPRRRTLHDLLAGCAVVTRQTGGRRRRD